MACLSRSSSVLIVAAICWSVVGLHNATGDETHWAFRRLARPAVPHSSGMDLARTSIDSFVVAKLAEQGLTISPDADRVTLVRRVYLDLIGLPPTPEEVDTLVADTAPDAHDRLIARLIASPRFGERWGRHWLDAVGYADTVGFDIDANNIITTAGKWRYRDYVIRAFNRDLPYDEFLRQQIAGDEMIDWRNAERFTDEIKEHLIATGFLRTAQDYTHEPESNIPLNMYAVLHDTIEIVGTSLLGITLQCSRCHDHKFDPLLQQDYYRLMACLTPAYNPENWRPVYAWKPEIKDRGLPDISPAELATARRHNEQLDGEIGKFQSQIAEIRARRKEALAADKGAGPEIKDEEVTAALTTEEKQRIDDLNNQVARQESHKRRWGTIQALYDTGEPPQTRLLERGDYLSPGDVVQPGFIQVLSRTDAASIFSADGLPDHASGRRTALANWLTDQKSPASALPARVIVNRIWQHLFGQGLVPTSENFGVNGQPPTHPELLEHLSSELIAHDWSLKWLIGEIVRSSIYRQASSTVANINPRSTTTDPQSIDPTNQLLWHMPFRRLDAEVIRDCILAISGNLNREMGGPPVHLNARPDGLVVIDEGKLRTPADKYRRSVYLLFRRSHNLSLLNTFDQPLIATTCARRSPAAVVSQSLAMMNDAFVLEQAEHFAARVATLASATDEQVETAFRLALSRPPNAREQQWCSELLSRQADIFRREDATDEVASRQALIQLCHTLLNTSEFLYAE
ncbi:MAG: DUF1549 and DUF1553 domain-containing protein [Planctomycetota bacterium]|nr:DUF1549 and DUF1553 domain-containing protein [Planctomycetota bacterium]